MALQRGVLELTADVDKDGTRETGVFELVGDCEIRQNMRILPIVGGEGSSINSVVTSRTAASPKRGQYFLDLGGGRHMIEIAFRGWEGAQDSDGNSLQWGNDGTGGSQTDATGEGPLDQMAVLNEYLRAGEFDSRAKHAKLRFGEYSDGTYASTAGRYDDFLHVVPVRTETERIATDPVSFTGSVMMVEAEDWRDVVDAFGKLQI